MATNVQYQISLKDLLSQGVNRAKGNVANFDSEIEKTIADINRLNATMLRTGGMGQSFMQTTGAVAIGSLMTRGVELAGRAAVSQVKDILSAGLDASKLRAEFSTLTGGKEMGDALFGDLTKYIQDSIFGTELYTSAKTLLSYGDSAKQILPDLKMLGDIAMGDKEKMQSLVMAFGQVMSTGKLMGQDLNQMIQGAGFNPLMVIAENTRGNKTIEQRYQELKKMGEAGEISFGMIRQAFESATSEGGRFYKMLDNIGQTPFGRLQAMQGNIEAAKQQLGEALLPAMSDFMDASKPLIDALPAMFKSLQPTIKSTINGFATLARWMAQNKEQVANIAHAAKLVAEAYLVWKTATVAITAAEWLKSKAIQANALFRSEEAAATNAVALATERLALANASAAASGMASGLPIAAGATGAAAGAGLAGLSIVGGALLVALAAGSIVAIAHAMTAERSPRVATGSGEYDKAAAVWGFTTSRTGAKVWGDMKHNFDAFETVADTTYQLARKFEQQKPVSKYGVFEPVVTQSAKNKIEQATKSTTADPLKAAISGVTGQQVKNIYVTINGGLVHEFNIKTTTLKESKPEIKRLVTEVLTDAINDSQITD